VGGEVGGAEQVDWRGLLKDRNVSFDGDHPWPPAGLARRAGEMERVSLENLADLSHKTGEI
jgi:hypothetical protein